ncbi:MAG: hypothetical protein R2809_08470 [Flavobacteriales bacterium]
MLNNRILIILGVIVTLLLIPFIAMQFTTEVKWTLFDFMAMGGLLATTGAAIEIILRTFKTKKQRLILSMVTVFLFLLTWAELAVGIFN